TVVDRVWPRPAGGAGRRPSRRRGRSDRPVWHGPAPPTVAPVAQWIEQQPTKLCRGGSNPPGGTLLYRAVAQLVAFPGRTRRVLGWVARFSPSRYGFGSRTRHRSRVVQR